ncbi:MAG: hypothetical protein RSD28_06655 [Lachnospiraceae bacterium]
MNIGMYVVIILGALIGGLPTLYITIGTPVIIAWKVYRKVHDNISIMD